MTDIFISYARDDESKASQIADALEKHGWSVWWDRTIPAGRVFDEVIEEAIDNARCVVVLWSASSSKSTWVKSEAAEGANRNVLVPVLLEDVRIPLGFRQIQAADMRGWEGQGEPRGLEKLIADIASIIGPPPEVTEATDEDSKLPTDATGTHSTGPQPAPPVYKEELPGNAPEEGHPLTPEIKRSRSEPDGLPVAHAPEVRETIPTDSRHLDQRRRWSKLVWSSLATLLVVLTAGLIAHTFLGEYWRPFQEPLPPSASGEFVLKAPDIAENGAVVPVMIVGSIMPGLRAELRSASGCWFSEFHNVSTAVITTYSTRVKMDQSDDLIALIESTGNMSERARKRIEIKKGSGLPCDQFSSSDSMSSADRKLLDRLVLNSTSQSGDAKFRVKLNGGDLTLKALFVHPMQSQQYIRTLGVYLNGKSLAYVGWGPLVAKNPYLSLVFSAAARSGDTLNIAWVDSSGNTSISRTAAIK